ncbi:putative surface anchored protein [Sporomusaceae bacterium BoRhaA]|uniref:hypothetical protein n=1 Tax=Pelorhabdus rhamnosifermentans TaxID=2772457 RepID=UPI001C063AAB|nr:hypothetical protein [Pelorhabdus rhamnosifermentans]MBU2703655.1 putative surface anchored protein [Pelorhabdus rhamnosifermentans]
MTYEEITKEILVAMIQNGKLTPTSKETRESLNSTYVEEVCKAFSAVYQTVSTASIKK